MKELIKNSLRASLSYSEYRALVQNKVEEGATTGPRQTPDLAEYTRLNAHRMKRLDKTVQLNDTAEMVLSSIQNPQTWLLITEGWCGDAAQALPVIHAMASASEKIDLKIVLRDENTELMDQFLTNGGRSIPKLIILDSKNEVLGSWGPRPADAQKLYSELREQGLPYSEINVQMQNWYNKNKTQDIQDEISGVLQGIGWSRAA